jgi:hypothetical protein
MEENAWLRATDPRPMLEFLQRTGRGSDRKLRLFASACCRLTWHLLGGRSHRKVVLMGERYAEGQATERMVEKARREAYYAPLKERKEAGPATWAAWRAADCLLSSVNIGKVVELVKEALDLENADLAEPVVQTPLHSIVRCVFGNPFSAPLPIQAAWLRWNDSTVLRIATGIYEERAFERLPVLADALLDAGCEDEDLIAHCRSAGPHVRGCFAIDLILGKE